jgi:hypothetical protein
MMGENEKRPPITTAEEMIDGTLRHIDLPDRFALGL